MPRTDYQRDLDRLRQNVVEMGEHVLAQYEQGLRAVETRDGTLGESVITGDHEINRRYLGLESDCIELIALQQPVAGDLRFIAASFKIITDLERVGDLATNLGRLAMTLDDPLHPALDFRHIADAAGEMVADAMTAYETGDADACREIATRDDQLDDACEAAGARIVRALIEEIPGEADHESLIEEATISFVAIRDLERVGDHAVNICARTLYMIENDDELIY